MENSQYFQPFPADMGKDIRVLVLDVDGVLTDGGLYYDSHGQSIKRFNVQDGLGIKIAMKHGIAVAVISGLDSPAVGKRLRDLGITDYYAGFSDKRGSLEKIRAHHNAEWDQMAYMGDDWLDLPVMAMVGLPMAVINAQPEVKEAAKFITSARGGDGAVREVIRHLLLAQGKYEAALAAWSNLC